MKKIAFATLGCKLNQYETQGMIEQVENFYEVSNFMQPNDVYVINSCAVTAKAAKESRHLVKKALSLNKNARVIYTGCDSYLEEDFGKNVVVLGNIYKQNLHKALRLSKNDIADYTKTYTIDYALKGYYKKSRAFVKIQEGCNNHCTYCIIPKLRGRERDKDEFLIIEELTRLSLAGFSEIVLTGTNIGSYRNIKKLLIKINASNIKSRIRISSIEPMYIDEEFLDIISDGNFAKHLHIPLQSGDDKILRLMGRDYTVSEYEKIVNLCDKKGIFTGTDIIVGFFQEDDESFKKTKNFIENIPLVYGHIFSYSKRPHTAAVNIKSNLERGPKVRNRNTILKNLFDRKFRLKMQGIVGSRVEFVTESTVIEKNNQKFYKAISSQYFPVLVKEHKKGIVAKTVKSFDGEYAYT